MSPKTFAVGAAVCVVSLLSFYLLAEEDHEKTATAPESDSAKAEPTTPSTPNPEAKTPADPPHAATPATAPATTPQTNDPTVSMVIVETNFGVSRSGRFIAVNLKPKTGYEIKPDTPLELAVEPNEYVTLPKAKFGWEDVASTKTKNKELNLPFSLKDAKGKDVILKGKLKFVLCDKSNCYLTKRDLAIHIH